MSLLSAGERGGLGEYAILENKIHSPLSRISPSLHLWEELVVYPVDCRVLQGATSSRHIRGVACSQDRLPETLSIFKIEIIPEKFVQYW